MDNFLTKIYKSKQTVFTSKEIAILNSEKKVKNLKSQLSYYVKKGSLFRVRRGFFVKDKDYDRKELATKIFTPSYVSLETVLAKEGVIFQYYSSIFLVSYLSRGISVNQDNFIYNKIKDPVILNQSGLINKGNHFEATKERAFLDRIYLSENYHFDNLNSINWDKCFEMIGIYDNKALEKRLNQYYKDYAR